MRTPEEVSAQIATGRVLFLAGDEALLRRLPRGDWVGGTSAYFIGEEGGVRTRDRLCAVDLPPSATGATIKVYGAGSIAGVYLDVPDNGYSLVVTPAGCPTMRVFALDGPRFEHFACRPLLGWISGVDLADLGRVTPKVFDGRTGRAFDDAAIVLHVALPKTKTAEVGIFNIFEPGDGDDLAFASDGFSATEVLVRGESRPFVRYLKERGIDTRLPLVADRNGVMVNTSFQAVDEASQEVRFFAPVFEGVRYRVARPVGDYVEAFTSQLPRGVDADVVYSCNCVLNYLHAGLEGRCTPGFTGAATFGEIAYQLLNQTLVYLRIVDSNLAERLRGETALRKQCRALEAATEELEAFNVMVSHDLRAPLRHMKAYSELLQASPSVVADAQARDCARRIILAADKLSGLLDDLLSFSRAGSGDLRCEPIDLGDLVAEAREGLRADCGERDIVWDVQPLPVVPADRVLMLQVFVNLLSNAVKYTRDRSQARVEVCCRHEGPEVVVTVRDNGIGFDAGAAGRLFKPFSRLESAKGFSGSGVGLAIVARIVARHRGRVWADAQPDRGASFSFSLPDS